MAGEPTNRAQARLDRIVDMKASSFVSMIVQEAVAEDLMDDEQLAELVNLSEQTRHLLERREKRVGYDDPIRLSVADIGEALDKRIHRRANEVVASVCASIVRQDDRWIADDPDEVGMSEIHAMEDAVYDSRDWLEAHEDVVARLDLTYPDERW